MAENEAITKELEQYKQAGANLLMPSIHISGMTEWHSAVIETVLLSPNTDDGDVYPHDNDGKKFRPTKQALMKLSVCAGVIWSPEQSRRIDNGADRNYIAYRAVGGIKKADGQPVFFSAEYDIDFEVMEEELKELYEKKAARMNNKSAKEKTEYIDYCVRRDMLQKRKFKLRLCEAGAMNRVLRMLLGIKQAYTVAELQKPFVTLRIVFRPDYSDKEVKKQLIDAHIRSLTGVYGPGSVQAAPDNTAPIDVTPCPPEGEKEKEGEGGNGDAPEGDSRLVDFQNLGANEKIATLASLARTKGYDLAAYLAKIGKAGTGDLNPEKQAGLFKHLSALPNDEDIPF